MRVLVAVTGSIAAYKAAEFVRELRRVGHEVQVLLTRGGARFVTADTFAALTGNGVLVDATPADTGAYPHLDDGRLADLLLIAPASADAIARLATGRADDVLGATAIAFDGPVVVAPAMNVRMWRHVATRRNVAQLREDGVTVVEPGAGELACGDVGEGRLADLPQIMAAVAEQAPYTTRGSAAVSTLGDDDATGQLPSHAAGALHGTGAASAAAGRGASTPDPGATQLLAAVSDGLAGRIVLITAGGTREPIDDVRYLGNRSSGRMGIALAHAAIARGADVRLIATATVDDSLLVGLQPVSRPDTADNLAFAVAEYRDGADVIVMAAAVSDFTTAATAGKLDRRDGTKILELQPTIDILAGLGTWRHALSADEAPLLVGFAADIGERGLARARQKLLAKGVDLIVFNDISRPDIGFDAPDNAVVIIGAHHEQAVPKGPKLVIADHILDRVERALHDDRSMVR